MTYTEFCKKIREDLELLTPDGWKLNLETIASTNQKKEGFFFTTEGRIQASPIWYIDCLWEGYQSAGNYGLFFTKFARLVQESFKQTNSDILGLCSPEMLKNRLMVSLVNTERNRELLRSCPTVEFQDLSAICRCIIDTNNGSYKSVTVTWDVANSLGMGRKELFTAAWENMKMNFPFDTVSLSDIFGLEDCPLYVITNSAKFHGASALLCTDCLEDLANRLDSDLIIFPSSIHEILCIPFMEELDPEQVCAFKCMVQDINQNVVEEEDFLSDNVYFFNREERQVTML